jgi:hypothetical protein
MKIVEARLVVKAMMNGVIRGFRKPMVEERITISLNLQK